MFCEGFIRAIKMSLERIAPEQEGSRAKYVVGSSDKSSVKGSLERMEVRWSELLQKYSVSVIRTSTFLLFKTPFKPLPWQHIYGLFIYPIHYLLLQQPFIQNHQNYNDFHPHSILRKAIINENVKIDKTSTKCAKFQESNQEKRKLINMHASKNQ